MAVLLLVYARSGGTILNKCLGSLPDTIVLSEVNPLGGGWGALHEKSFTTVRMQAKEWYGINIEEDDFLNGVVALENYCDKNNKKLIIRDWSFVNFSKHEYNSFCPPNRFLSHELLSPKINLKTFAFVRDSIDVWISRGMPPIERFFRDYLTYIESIIELNIPIFRYEDFCANPQHILKEICDWGGLRYKDVSKSYTDFHKVNGDVQIISRGAKKAKISRLLRKNIPLSVARELNNSKEMQKCNELVGYPTHYQTRIKQVLLHSIKHFKKHVSY